MEKSGGNVEEVDGVIPFHDFTMESFFTGKFHRMDNVKGNYGESLCALVSDENGRFSHLPSATDLTKKCSSLIEGDEIFVELTDETFDSGKGNPMKIYNVLRVPR